MTLNDMTFFGSDVRKNFQEKLQSLIRNHLLLNPQGQFHKTISVLFKLLILSEQLIYRQKLQKTKYRERIIVPIHRQRQVEYRRPMFERADD